ncbi:unnamed protein product [Dovyalis caffra]|uniref:2-methoxy-6-polyprenyl-1,4-benzoquinol methylase, mitochondrial n=1 Tax=Dovyalis caffra TaxID=77055 RepID=A0AAV1RM91_9ROSI|nr:unnamed protein product [Dovyalis caffra]
MEIHAPDTFKLTSCCGNEKALLIPILALLTKHLTNRKKDLIVAPSNQMELQDILGATSTIKGNLYGDERDNDLGNGEDFVWEFQFRLTRGPSAPHNLKNEFIFCLGGRLAVMALRLVSRKLGSKFLPMLSSTSLLHSHATSFGFKHVREEEKSQMVGDVFSSVASNYDLMNDVMSGGLHRLWKDRLVSMLNPFPGMKHLDVAGGTGDVAFRILDNINSIKGRASQDPLNDHLQEETQIYVCDINPNMLNVGKKRAIERGLGENKSLVWVEGDAEALSFEDNTMDGYTIAFGIRNVTHIEKVLAEAYRVLKQGGRFLCLELSHVEVPVFKELYDYYSFSVIPALGELVAGDRESYQYLVESIRRFPLQEKFASMIADAGFQKVEYENLVGGVKFCQHPDALSCLFRQSIQRANAFCMLFSLSK